MKENLIADLSSLTHINQSLLNKITECCNTCICDCVYELDKNNEDVLSINIGIGTLEILLSDSELTYGFIPSSDLENKIIKTIEYKQSPLLNELELNLNNKMLSVYKDLL